MLTQDCKGQDLAEGMQLRMQVEKLKKIEYNDNAGLKEDYIL